MQVAILDEPTKKKTWKAKSKTKKDYLLRLITYLPILKIKIFIMLMDKVFLFYKYMYIRISLFLCMHVQTSVG
jgi:hypothetical protein